MPTVNDRLYNSAVRHQIGILRYSTSVATGLIGEFNRATNRLFSIISDHDPSDGQGSFSNARLQALLASLEAVVNAIGKDLVESFDGSISELAEEETEYNLNVIDKSFPTDVVRGIKSNGAIETKRAAFFLRLNAPSKEQILAAIRARPFNGALLADYYDDLPRSIMRKIKAALSQGFTNGQTTEQIIRTIRGSRAAKYTDGILQQSRTSIEKMTRTALNHTATVARDQIIKANADIVDSVRWVSTLDMRTSDICQELDGQTFPIDSGPRPPAHFNCRSTIVPITKSWRELGFDIDELPPATRASMDGQVPATETYQTWVARQSKGIQDDVLGTKRAELFRDGKLSLDRFTDTPGNSLTIEQLKKRDAAVEELS